MALAPFAAEATAASRQHIEEIILNINDIYMRGNHWLRASKATQLDERLVNDRLAMYGASIPRRTPCSNS